MVYPGAMHTRFEHSLGVMHVATQMYNCISRQKRNLKILEDCLCYDKHGIDRDHRKVRLAALLHDVGHPPFSHAGEKLFPKDPATNKRFRHEDYSAAVVRFLMCEVIQEGNVAQNHQIRAKDVADLIAGSHEAGRSLLWRELFDGPLDADRADYLLRDSHHIGVAYGRYDLDRILSTITLGFDPESNSPRIAIEHGGRHAAEGLILARYMMFTQVYFHHTRRAYDYHIEMAVRDMLSEQQKDTDLEQKDCFPPPTSKENIENYLEWTDWKVLGLLANGAGGLHGDLLRDRNHFRCVFATPELPSTSDFEVFNSHFDKLIGFSPLSDSAEKSWYPSGGEGNEILIVDEISPHSRSIPLSQISCIVDGLKKVIQRRIYVSSEYKSRARDVIEQNSSGV